MVLVLRRLFNTLRCQGRGKEPSSCTITKSTAGALSVLKRWKAQGKKSVPDIRRLGMIPREHIEDVDALLMSMTMTLQPGKIPQLKDIDQAAYSIPELQATGSFSDDSTVSEQSLSSMSEYSKEDSYFFSKRKATRSRKSVTFLLPDWDLSSKSFLQPTRCESLMLGVMPQIDEEASHCPMTDDFPEIPNDDDEESSLVRERPILIPEDPFPKSCSNGMPVAGCLRNGNDSILRKPSQWIHMVGSMPETIEDPYEDNGYPSDEEDDMDEDDDTYEEQEIDTPTASVVVTSRSLATGRLAEPVVQQYDEYPYDEIHDRMQVELFR